MADATKGGRVDFIHLAPKARIRRYAIFLLALASTIYLCLFFNLADYPEIYFDSDAVAPSSYSTFVDSGLDAIGRIYVLSLPQRQDRRNDMAVLAQRLSLNWSIIDAISSKDPLITTTFSWVNDSRYTLWNDTGSLAWPSNIDSLVDSDEYLGLWENPHSGPNVELGNYSLPHSEIPVSSEDFNVPASVNGLPDWMFLTIGRVACWYSHLNAIHLIANLPRTEAPDDARATTGLILEDDVDMEEEINDQLTQLWPYLPADWDIVFLGHCWSDEARYPAISIPSQFGKHNHSQALSSADDEAIDNTASSHALHPSNAPKCTHAYALSRKGARRLLLHLRYPPFAFSRAIDQAFEWLIISEKLKSFSVVPPLVIQRKSFKSDIKEGGFGVWKESLMKGVLGGFDD